MLPSRPTPEELRPLFERALRELALRGKPIPTDTGLNRETYKALMDVVRAYPSSNPALIAVARAAFERQMTQSRTNRS